MSSSVRTRSRIRTPGVAGGVQRASGLILPGGAAPFSPLSIPWTHAYWAEGPEFLALGLANGAAVATWPDEASTADMTQGTAGNRPAYRSAESTMGNKPCIDFVGTNAKGLRSATYTAMAMPNEIVMVARAASLPVAGGQILWSIRSSDNSQSHFVSANNNLTWKLYNGINLVGVGLADTNKHYWRVVFNDPNDLLELDGTSYVAGDSSGSNLYNTYRHSFGADGTGTASVQPMIAFVGYSDTLLTAQQRTDLLAWSRSYYGTP